MQLIFLGHSSFNIKCFSFQSAVISQRSVSFCSCRIFINIFKHFRQKNLSTFLYLLTTQSVLLEPATLVLSGSLLETQNVRLHPRLWNHDLHFNKTSADSYTYLTSSVFPLKNNSFIFRNLLLSQVIEKYSVNINM